MASERLDAARTRLREEALQHGLNPRDADLLLSDALGKPLSFLIAHGDATVDTSRVEEGLRRRRAGEPLQYIRNRTEFFSLEFYVDDRVLVPRPETEILVETAIDRAPAGARVVDIGTGSGCIAISLERARPDLHVIGVDVSVAALAVADRNRRQLGSKVKLAASDLLEGCRATFDVIVSNPPYIAEGDVENLAREVRDYEPRIALTPGPRGTETIERILSGAGDALVLLEIGFGQESLIRDVATAHSFHVDSFVDDLAGIPRVVVLSRRGQ